MTLRLILRSLVIWSAILVMAIANGALRQGWLNPTFGEAAGHIISTFVLSAVIMGVTFATISWMGPATRSDLWTIGVFWLGLTVAFEFLGGHFLFRRSWDLLLADYQIQAGRIWIFVLLSTLLSPPVAGRSLARNRLPASVSCPTS